MYIVIEIQTSAEGSVGNFVWAFSELSQAEAKYHSILAAAAVSQIYVHAAVLLSNDGRSLAAQSYNHRK